MKHILIFILLCFASDLWAQYPNGANKLVLGRQTTGDGLIFRGDSIPSFTPTSNANAWFFLDTAAQVLYTHIGGTWVSLADTITSGGTVTLSGEVVGESNATKLDTVDRVIFDPTNGGADSTYKLTYNANDFTLHFGMGLGNQVYQMGQELYYPPCINKTASTIYAGQPVMIDTSGIIQGDRLAVMPAFANGLPANYIVGVAAHDIAPDAEGLVTWFGYVREVDESDIAASGVTLDVGDILYLSATPGKYSDIEPAAPAINSTIALVVRKPNANNMTLLVRPWLNEKLGDLTDVELKDLTDGQVLTWDSINGVWEGSSKQDPLTGTGLVKSTGGTISYVTDNSADWNAAYNDRITGAAFTGSTTKTLTLTQQDAGTVTASFTDLQGVTSVATGVGLSGGTITTTGTIIADTTVLVSKTFLTNQGYTSNVGTVTSVATGVGLTGGTITSSGTISADTTVLASKTWTETRGYLTSEVDGSVTNEGSLTVGAGTGTTSVINSNTSGSTGVTISASTGLSISEAGNTITLTNSAPDQTVSLTGAGITSISGTYPSFTITGTEVDGSTTNELQNLGLSGQSLTISSGSGVTLPVVGITAGTGISTTSASGDFTITNSAPESTTARNVNATGEGVFRDEVGNELQFKKLVAGSNITLTGADSTVTIAASGGGTGTVTSITAGTGLTGGTITTSGTIGLTGQALALHNLSTNGIISRTGAGTVAARTLTAGTGISISNGDGVSGNPTITNSAPDQTVSITGAGINSVSGSYPNFTITGTEVDGSVSNEGSLTVGAGASNTSIINSNTSGSTGVTIEASTGLSIAESGSTITLTNSAPDQTVSISGAGINSVSGTYPNFTITGTEVDGSTTNELQNLSLTGQTLGISSGSGVTLPVVGITAGTGISTTSASGDFTITNSAPESTTARNVNATGEGVFRDEVGNELQFKKLVAGSNITLTGADSTVTIAASGGGSGFWFRNANEGSSAISSAAMQFSSSDTLIISSSNTYGNSVLFDIFGEGDSITSNVFPVYPYVNESVIASVARLADTASTLRALIPTGGGTVAANKVAFGAASGDTLTSNTNLHWDNTNGRLGINNTSPSERLQVGGNVRSERMIINAFSNQTLTFSNHAPALSQGFNLFINSGSANLTASTSDEANQNLAFGTGALSALTTGGKNSAIGNFVLNLLTTGSANTGIGTQALAGLTTGSQNFGIGTGALAAIVNESDNIAIGHTAGFLIRGSSNTLIGSTAGQQITSGSNLTAMGGYAAYNLNGGGLLTSASNGVFIGYGTRASANGNTNEVVLGYEGRGNGSNTTTLGNTSTTGTFLAAGNLNLTGQGATAMQTARHTTAGQAGNNLTIKVGGAASGATNAAGGDLILESGVSTGTGSSNIIFETAAEGSSGTTDRTPTERMRIDGNGNVGIGDNFPVSAKLLIRSGTYNTMRLVGTTTGDQSVIQFFGSNNSTGHGAITYNSTSTQITRSGNLPMLFYTNNAERLIIKGDGLVGIGTIDPKATLHVNGSLSRNAPVVVNAASDTVAVTTSWIIVTYATGNCQLTLPTASDWTGRELMIKTTVAQTVTSDSSNVVPLAGGSAGTAILSATAGKWATLVSDGNNWIIMQAN